MLLCYIVLMNKKIQVKKKSLMHPIAAKLAEDEIITYTFTTNYKRQHPFFPKLP